MKVLVVGPQHSCTRLFVGLIDRHPDVEFTAHMSIPHNADNVWIWEDISIEEYFNKFDAFVIVDRDSSCVNSSNKRDYNLDNLSEKSKGFLLASLEAIIHREGTGWFKGSVVMASFESLVSYKKMYLIYMFSKLNLDPSIYNYDLQEVYRPLTEGGIPHWFEVDLEIKDANKKYFK